MDGMSQPLDDRHKGLFRNGENRDRATVGDSKFHSRREDMERAPYKRARRVFKMKLKTSDSADSVSVKKSTNSTNDPPRTRKTFDMGSKSLLRLGANATRATTAPICVLPSLKHPLLMDHIVESILNLLPDTDVAACAKVCQTWHLEAIRALRHRHNVRLESEMELNCLLIAMKRFTSSRVSGITLRGYPNNYESRITSLLPYIKHTLSVLDLIIMHNEDLNGQNISQILHQFICSCPNLAKLGLVIAFCIVGLDGLVPNGIFPILDTNGAFKAFPGVHTVSIISISPLNIRTIVLTFPNVETLLIVDPCVTNPGTVKHLRLPKLRILDIKIVSDSDIYLVLHCFVSLKLRLVHLSLTMILDSLNITPFKRFIESQAPTLESLELIKKDRTGMKTSVSCETPFPLQLVNLVYLSIDKPFLRNVNHLTQSFPALKILHFNFHPNSNWTGIIPNCPIPNPNMTYLSIDWIDNNSLEKFLPTFPNLVTLRLTNCNDCQARIIFRTMTQLKHLVLEAEGGDSIDSSLLTDKGITGLERADFRRLAEGVKAAEVRKHPYIGSLTKLLSVNLGFRNSNRATGACFLYGTLDLNLHTLAVSGLRMSPSVIACILRNGFKLLHSEHPIVGRMRTAARTAISPDYVFHKTSNNEEVGNEHELSCEFIKFTAVGIHKSISVMDF